MAREVRDQGETGKRDGGGSSKSGETDQRG